METAQERESLCKYLLALTREKGHTNETLSQLTGIPATKLQKIFEGNAVPTLDEVIIVCNAIDMKITIHQSLSFAHQKLVNTGKPTK